MDIVPHLSDEDIVAPGVRHPPVLLRAAGVGALAVALMLVLGVVISSRPFEGDRAIILALHGVGPGWVRRAMVDITALGGGTVLTLVVVVTAGLLLVHRLWLTALLIAVASSSGSLVVDLLKYQFGRSRPDIVDHLVEIGGMSFPSGHAANSAIVYLTIAGLVTQVVRGRMIRNYVIAVAIVLVGAIGLSRVYLGVHWPSDVLAGWSFGTLWALCWWLVGAQARESLRHKIK